MTCIFKLKEDSIASLSLGMMILLERRNPFPFKERVFLSRIAEELANHITLEQRLIFDELKSKGGIL